MVGSSLSSTNFSQKPYFFRVAPANDRQAQVAARVIERTEALRGRPMHLVRSPGDEYSSDLADACSSPNGTTTTRRPTPSPHS